MASSTAVAARAKVRRHNALLDVLADAGEIEGVTQTGNWTTPGGMEDHHTTLGVAGKR